MTTDGGIQRSDLSDATMRKLIDEQFPWLAGRELGRRYTLEDHLSVRIGDDYGAIFPRFERYDSLYARVANLLRPVASNWTFYASHPVATGIPGHGYPYHWVIVDWNSASTAGFVPLNGSSAHSFGKAIREIHIPCSDEAPVNPLTGVGLEALRPEFEQALQHALALGATQGLSLKANAIRAVFEAGTLEGFRGQRTWTHGRLEPRAVLSDRGEFRGILLWHNFGAGDPAADLGYGANLLSLDVRDRFWSGYGGVDGDTVTRAHAYQVYAALRFLQVDDPFLTRMAWDRIRELGLVDEA